MFSESAGVYDLIYGAFKDYPAEVDRLAETVRRGHPAARTLLDVACGTGEHARLLREHHGYDVDGVDLDPAMVRIAAAKNPAGTFSVADMTDFSLPRTYDVVTCLFSSIGYARTLPGVQSALAAFARHLAPGGFLLVEPWFEPGVLQPGRIAVQSIERDGTAVARMSHVSVDGGISRLRFEYLVGTPDGVRHASELHELGIFTRDEMLAAFAGAGLAATYDPSGLSDRGLYLARPR
jgi:SAM-dependent methyltransferase